MMVIGLKHSVKNAKDAAVKELVHTMTQEFLRRFAYYNGSITCRDLLGHDLSTEEGRRQVHEKGLTQTVCVRVVRMPPRSSKPCWTRCLNWGLNRRT